MGPSQLKRRRGPDDVRPPKKKVRKVKKQTSYHSSSDDEDDTLAPGSKYASGPNAIDSTASSLKPKSILKHKIVSQPVAEGHAAADEPEAQNTFPDEDELVKNTALNTVPAEDSADEDDQSLDEEPLDDEPDIETLSTEDSDEAGSESEASLSSSQASLARRKRNDPDAFATSISKILDTKLSTSKRSDPVLSRSKSAAEANKALADGKLEQRARAQIRSEKRQALERGRVKDVLGLQDDSVDTGRVLEEEKRLKKTAQRGVVKLFNAVRAAQVHAETARASARAEGVVGAQKREERINEMSKQGFLDLISSGGKKMEAAS